MQSVDNEDQQMKVFQIMILKLAGIAPQRMVSGFVFLDCHAK
jgi:hypothetical protein